jgi:choice-of-anchor B domain-containing protein
MFRLLNFVVFCFCIWSSWAQFDAKNVTLLDHWTTDTLMSMQNIRFNEVWYFERQNREYAIIGSTEGTHFFEITNADALRFVQFVPGRARNSQIHNRDFRDFGNYVYAVADQGLASSLQIINISGLPDTVFVEGEDTTQWNRVHTLAVDHEAKLLYACSFTPPSGGDGVYSPLNVFSLENPIEPILVFSGFSGIQEVHYAYVRNSIAYLNCGFDGLRIYNFSNPSNPVLLGNLSVYGDQGYNHSGWLSEDGRTYYFTDETEGKRVKKVDVSDIANLMVTATFGTKNAATSTAHHIVPVGDLAFVSYYNNGLQIFDTRSPVKAIAYFDTYPLQSSYSMNGAWGVYPFRQGTRVLVSDRSFGLFLLGFDYDVFAVRPDSEELLLFPNPLLQNGSFSVFLNDREVNDLRIDVHDLKGKLVHRGYYPQQTYGIIELDVAQGMYIVSAHFVDYLGDVVGRHGKLLVGD